MPKSSTKKNRLIRDPKDFEVAETWMEDGVMHAVLRFKPTGDCCT